MIIKNLKLELIQLFPTKNIYGNFFLKVFLILKIIFKEIRNNT